MSGLDTALGGPSAGRLLFTCLVPNIAQIDCLKLENIGKTVEPIIVV